MSATRDRQAAGRSGRLHRIRSYLTLGLMGLVAGGYLYFTSDRVVRRQVIKVLENLTGGQVELEYASLSIFEHLRLKGLRIYPPNLAIHPKHLTFSADDIILRHRPWELALGRLGIKSIVLQGIQLKTWYYHDSKKTNLHLFKPVGPSEDAAQHPAIYLRDCQIEYREMAGGQSGSPTVQHIAGSLWPDASQNNLYEIDLHSGAKSILKNATLRGQFDFQDPLKRDVAFEFDLEEMDSADLPPHVFQGLKWGQWYELAQPSGRMVIRAGYDPDMGPNLTLQLEGIGLQVPFPAKEREGPEDLGGLADFLARMSGSSIQLHDVNARVVYSRQKCVIENISGRFEELFGFYIHGQTPSLTPGAPLDLTLGTRDLDIPVDQWSATEPGLASVGEKLELLERLVAAFQNPVCDHLIEMLLPTGKLDVEMHFTGETGSSDLQTSGEFICREANFIYEHFPYPLTGVSGIIAFDQKQVTIGPVTCLQGGTEITCQGVVLFEQEGPSANMTVRVSDGQLDQTLYNAFDPQQKAAWDQYNPTGLVDVIYHSTRAPTGEMDFQLEVDLRDVQAAYQGFTVPVTGIEGQLHMTPSQTDIRIDRARASGGQIRLQGTMANDENIEGLLEGGVEFQDFVLDEHFTGYLPPEMREHYQHLDLTGRADGHVELRSLPPASEGGTATLGYRVTADLRETQFLYDRLPYRLDDVEAQVELTNDELVILSLSGNNGLGWFHLEGRFRGDEDFQIYLDATDAVLNEELQHALAEYDDGLWQKLCPQGRVNAHLEVQVHPEKSDIQLTGTIEPVDCTVRFQELDYLFRNVNGLICLEPGVFVLEEITSSQGSAFFEASGSIQRDDIMRSDIHVWVSGVKWDEQFNNVLPAGLKSLQKKAGLNATLGADVQVNYQAIDDLGGLWGFAGDLVVTDAGFTVPMATDNIQSRIRGQGHYDSQTEILNFEGDLLPSSLSIKKRPITDLQAHISYDGAERQCHIRDINGQIFQGHLGGQIDVDQTEQGLGYALQLQGRNIDLARFLDPENTDPARNRKLRGQLEASFNLSQPNPESPRRGSFEINVNEAVLGELPFYAQLLHIPNLTWPRAGAFNEVKIVGNITGDVSRMDTIFLRGSAISLHGMGIMTEPGHQLNLVFSVGSPHDLPVLPLLDIRPLMRLGVTGSFDDPKIESIPLPYFQKLLSYFMPESSPLP